MQDERDHLVLSESEQFKALGHPLRHRLLMALRQRPATLAQLAAALAATKGTIGYHVKVLEQAKMVRLAYVRRVRGGTEQYYEPTSPRLRIAADAPVGGDFLIKAALSEMLPPEKDGPDVTFLRHLRLTGEQAHALAAALEQFADGDHIPEPGAGQQYGLLLSLHRSNIPVLPDDEALTYDGGHM
ncbi:winged helix-turn-helix domain-containing protein [Paractinoplanes durhamensis]|nr:winged helix-turn-helix domain-containing protein [Actinoplanes durhamensis]